jgi:hypothetical protein
MTIACQICGSAEAARPKAPGVFLTETRPIPTAKYGQQMPSMVWLPLRHAVKLAGKIMKIKPAAEAGPALVELDRTDESQRNRYVRKTV